MGQQHRKVVKRRRRKAYMERRKLRIREESTPRKEASSRKVAS